MGPLNLASAKDLISKKVLDTVGHEYGTIKDLIIDKNSQKILLVVISEGGFAGTELGSNYVAIPWNKLNVNPNTYTCILGVNTGEINNSPRFDYSDLIESKTEVLNQIFDYYGRPENWNKEEGNDTVISAQPVHDKHQSLKGSEYQTKNIPDDESKLANEMDFDKLTGKSDK